MAEAKTTAPLAARGILDSRIESLANASDAVRIEVLPPAVQLNLRLDTARASLDAVRDVLGGDLPGPLSSATTPAGRTLVWLGPDEWLVIDPMRTAELEASLRAAVAGAGAVVEQSGQRISILLEGDVPALLAKGTAIDLHPDEFPRGAAVQAMLGQAVVVFVSRSDDASRVELIARTSFAPYVADWLLDALADPLAYPAPHGG
ncbi:sarcosine oxidase subunit gamma [Microbacterium ureisolvens]|nr:sarcosine oxidase subunit gamma family protein [Microbacterium ureisolvens]